MTLRLRLLAGSLLCTGTAAFASVAARAQPVQGVYVSLGGGANLAQDQTVRLSPQAPGGKFRYGPGVTGLGSVGYGFGNGLRLEVEGNYRNDTLQHFRGTRFPTEAGGHQESYGGMVNALFDMDIGKSWLYPYFGFGVGYGWSHMDAHYSGTNYPYATRFGGTDGNFAYQGIFGLSVPVPWVVGLSTTFEYRFYSILGPQRFTGDSLGSEGSFGPKPYGSARGNQDITTNYNHSLLVGLRYEFNPAPPPPPPAPAEVPSAPAPTEARTYLVFFDWDRSDLTGRAREIVAQAAQASTHVQTTRIEVNGYTDNSSIHGGARGARYNQGLSVRRAQSVKAELIRDGVPASAIDIHGYGETHPLVATGPNTREPQNRRVEIILH
ncbi:OmpA family protein [Rhizosaccharibacter radicis]|uniref:OmpA family protein n=1 Tax=Rhizosaccharibacter radicis TaxID=2782605 RepID=A0ABT1W2K3_9PROT|nr:OmpA family protein [Acetobacteraceae bacterium KSS12]